MQEFNLSFSEAMEVVAKGKAYIQGNGFKSGVFLNLDDGQFTLFELGEFGSRRLHPFTISLGIYNQQYRCFTIERQAKREEI